MLPRSTLVLLVISVVIRGLTLSQPIIDGMHLRQTQTADAIASMQREGGFPLSAEASWRGDLKARVAQEFPIYNHVSLLLVRAGLPIPMAGKIVSLILWVLAFLALQAVWPHFLSRKEAFWANLLFVASPLSVFFGQAVMPESLVLLLTYGFLALWLRHLKTGSLLALWLAAGVACLGLLVKLPAFFYVGIFAGLTLIATGQWRRLLNFQYLLIAILLGVAVKFWMDFANEVTMEHFARWSASKNVAQFIGPLSERISPAFWARITAYNFFLVATPLPFLLCFAANAGRRPGDAPPDRAILLGCYWASVLAFVLVFGPHTASNHSYYNFPMLVPLAALFGIAAVKIPAWIAARFGGKFRNAARAAVFLAVIPGTVPFTLHLYGRDNVTYEVARWIKENTTQDQLTVVRLVNSGPTPDVPTVSFYAERRLWIWSPYMTDAERDRALATSDFAILSKPPADTRNSVIRFWHRFRGFRDPEPERGFPPPDEFVPLADFPNFTVFKKQKPASP